MESRQGTKDYLKVRREGGSKVLTVGNVIPDGWRLVTLTLKPQPDKKKLLIEIKRVD